MGADELIETDAWGSALASWSPLLTLLGAFAVIVVALLVTGRGSALERIPDALGAPHRRTRAGRPRRWAP